MFERFKKTQPAETTDGTGRTAVADRTPDERPVDDDRTAVRDPEQRATLADRDDHRDHDHDDDHSTRNAALAGGAGVAAGEVAGRHHERKEERRGARDSPRRERDRRAARGPP